nr:MAG TPA: hypothetical protein [Caudoviricetes sp.]
MLLLAVLLDCTISCFILLHLIVAAGAVFYR